MQVKWIWIFIVLFPLLADGQGFTSLETVNKPVARHECAAAVVNKQLFLLGGRGNRPVNRFHFKKIYGIVLLLCQW